MKLDARTAAMRALLRINEQNGYSNLALKQLFSGDEMEERDRALASILVYGVLERRITLDYVIATNSKRRLSEIAPPVLEALRLGVYQLLYMDRIPASAAINESVKAAKRFDGIQSAGFVNAVLHAVDRSGKNIQFPPEKNWKTYLSTRYSCPQWLVKLWAGVYGKEACEALLQNALGRPPMTVRVNTQRISAGQLQKQLEEMGVVAQPHPLLPDALNLEETGAIERLPAFEAGLFHVQDAASQLCCRLLNPQPGERIADVCAAPGGKSFTIAEQLHDQGEVAAFDLYPQRVRLIEEGAVRLGLRSIRAAVRDAAMETSDEALFDRVLCDAPCSGLGVLRRKPEIRYKQPESLESLPETQLAILEQSSRLVRPGGVLFYSTCTLNPSENGMVAQCLTEKHPELRPLALQLPENLAHAVQEPENQLTLLPHVHQTDGFFIAAFRRSE